MNKPEQLRLAADIIEKGLEWEARCVDPKCPKADCKQWQKANSELLNIISAQMEHEIRIKPTDPHPNRKEVEEGIRQGKRWQFKHKSEPDTDTEWRSNGRHTPQWDKASDYRLAPETKKVPLGPKDIQPGSVLGHPDWANGEWMMIIGNGARTMIGYINGNQVCLSYEQFMEQGYLISRDFGKTWHPCEKDEPSA